MWAPGWLTTSVYVQEDSQRKCLTGLSPTPFLKRAGYFGAYLPVGLDSSLRVEFQKPRSMRSRFYTTSEMSKSRSKTRVRYLPDGPRIVLLCLRLGTTSPQRNPVDLKMCSSSCKAPPRRSLRRKSI